WFMDIQPHGRTWVNRRSAMNNDNATDILNRAAWTKLLEDSGFQYNFVSYRDVLQRGAAALNGYHVLILPRTLALSDAEAAAIREWVRQGGTLIADYLPGVFDEHGKGRASGALDDVFGVQRNAGQGVLDGKAIAEVNAELGGQPLASRLSYAGARRDRSGMTLYERSLHPTGKAQAQDTVEGVASGVSNQFGNGSTYYMNWTPLPYLIARAGDEGQKYRQRLTEQLQWRQDAKTVALQPRVRVLSGGKELPLAERLFWKKNGKHYLCIVMNPLRMAKVNNAGTVNGLITDAPVDINLQFQAPITGLKNERTGRLIGNGQSFTDRWVPCESNIYSW
ncbi:MAG: beta-galactosidase trimerization domain-containing protein, partial [Abitibacteriaceae bacterium]|nr:beta-galactosidase trimerization domain-containing protein [Abditibacteriaceae bacterium]